TLLLFSSLLPSLPASPLFPYTTLFRSQLVVAATRGVDLEFPPGKIERLAVELILPHQLPAGWVIRRPCDDVPEHANQRGNNRFRSEEHTSELQSRSDLVCRLLLEKKKK